MGFFDFMGTSMDDPKTMATLGLAQQLMSGRGNGMNRLAAGMQGYGATMGAAKQEEEERKRRAMQMEMQKMQMMQLMQAQEKAKQMERVQANDSGLMQRLMGMPVEQQQAPGAMGPGAPMPNAGIDPRTFLAQGGSRGGLMEAMALNDALRPPKPPAPMVTKPGDIGRDPTTFQELWRNPAEAKEAAPTNLAKLIQERDALPPGHPNRALYDQEIRKATTHAPGTTVNVNAEKPLLNTMAQGLGKQIDDSLAVAKSAVPAINTAHTLRAAVDSGKLVSGPGASFRVMGLQIGQMLGVGGKDGAEILSNTRTAIQSMAQAELSAAQQMKGQGQITEAERAIIRRAAAGDINELTSPELRLLSEVMEKTARFKIAQHQKNVQGLSKMPGAEALMPFYQVEDPSPYAAPGAGVRRYNPATGRIE